MYLVMDAGDIEVCIALLVEPGFSRGRPHLGFAVTDTDLCPDPVCREVQVSRKG